MNAPAGAPGPAVPGPAAMLGRGPRPPPPPAMAHHMPHPAMQPNPYYNVTCLAGVNGREQLKSGAID